jgi:hypothetical protein
LSTPWIVVVSWMCLVLVGLVAVVAGLLRRVAVVLESQPVAGSRDVASMGPEVGSRLPDLVVGRSDGEQVALSDLPGPFVLAMLTSHCGPCLTIVEWLRDHPSSLESAGALVVLTDAGGREVLGLDDIATVVSDDAGQMFDALNVPGTPFAISVGSNGDVESSDIVAGRDHLLQMLGVPASPQIEVRIAG